jgi:ABC-type uncharacterized transport system ATPase subunit
MGPAEAIIEVRDVFKTFPGGVVAADGMSLELKRGEIHALLGENGAGKTTLMNILYGYLQPDAGEIRVGGERVVLKSPRDAIRLGIGMVHQHFTLVPTLTVAENIVLGMEIRKGPFLDRPACRARVEEIAAKYSLGVSPGAEVANLSAGEKQRVEIIKALYRDAKVLILDEPTGSLTPQETEDLMVTLRISVKKEDLTVIFITHKLPEALQISDRITVLRKGRVIGTVETSSATEKSLALMMVGKEVVFDVGRGPMERGEELLRVSDLSVTNEKGRRVLQDVAFAIHAGELLGVAGIAGNGQAELAQVLLGLMRPSSGSVKAFGEDLTAASTEKIIRHGIGFIPEDRKKDGAIGSFTIAQNLVLNAHVLGQFTTNRVFPFFGNSSISWAAVGRYAERMIAEYDVLCPSKEALARHLSGGNLQKCILAREINRNLKILIAQNPTKGLDIRATEFVRNKLLEQCRKGTGIILISEDLDEIMNLCDRIAVMHAGRIVGIVSHDDANKLEIGLMMAGAR